MRALLATAGLFLLAGSAAAAGAPTGQTLRKTPSGAIEAVAQDGGLVAWFSSSTRACDAVHVLSPGSRDQTLPQPSSDSMTCHWDLAEGQPQLAIAARISTALWTLHESGPTSFDYVLAAPIGGAERRIDRLAHASNGTGDWLGDVTGGGRTLAYSYVDVEYVDPLACLSGGSCQQRIAGGGIRVVSPASVASLPGASPALGLATAAGRIAYIPATTVGKNGQPGTSAGASLQVVDAVTGDSVSQVSPAGLPLAIALSQHVLAVLTQNSPHDRISWYDPADGTKLGSVPVSQQAAPQLATSGRLVVYRVGRVFYGVSTQTNRIRSLAKTTPDAVGPSLGDGQLIWAENDGGAGRLRTLGIS